MQSVNGANGEGLTADVSVSFDEPSAFDDSYYPDPTLPGRMLGLGYYQQDDSPDKILFDPYQTPTVESLETRVRASWVRQEGLACRQATRSRGGG